MGEVNGWYLPTADSYFGKFLLGTPKSNGFQRDHLLKAFDHVINWNVAVDVGAHVGFWTRDLAARFDRVYAYEPAPDSYACLKRNTVDLLNVELANAAVGMYVGKCDLTEDATRTGNTGSRFVTVSPKGKGSTPMLALDNERLEGCGLLKIDVEGFESDVLMGAAGLIKEHRPVVIMETDKKFPGRYDGKPKSRDTIIAMGYREVVYADARGKNAIRPDRIFVPV